jgi:hypothetical protein
MPIALARALATREAARFNLAAARLRLMRGFLDEMFARLGGLRAEAEEAGLRAALGVRAESLRADAEAEARAAAVRAYMRTRGVIDEGTQRRLALAAREGARVGAAAAAAAAPTAAARGRSGFLHYPHDSLGFAEARWAAAPMRRGGAATTPDRQRSDVVQATRAAADMVLRVPPPPPPPLPYVVNSRRW